MIATLKEMKVEFKQHQDLPEALCLSSLQPVKQSLLFVEGKIIVQDLSSMLPATILQPQKDSCVLDMCAAPGGKTTQLSAIMKNSGKIIACDLHPHRVELIEENIKRLGIDNIECFAADATNLEENFVEYFDYILLDAPCSGLGVLNRRADLRWKVRKSALVEIETTQKKLLESAAKYLKSGGTMVYSTCTLNKKENELQIAHFLETHPNFELISFNCLNKLCASGMETIYPFVDHSDGFFIAKIIRKD